MSVRDIHAACEEMLGRKVLYGSIKEWLSDNNKTGRVTRVKLGSYVLVKPDGDRREKVRPSPRP